MSKRKRNTEVEGKRLKTHFEQPRETLVGATMETLMEVNVGRNIRVETQDFTTNKNGADTGCFAEDSHLLRLPLEVREVIWTALFGHSIVKVKDRFDCVARRQEARKLPARDLTYHNCVSLLKEWRHIIEEEEECRLEVEAYGGRYPEIEWPRDDLRFKEHFDGNLIDLYYPPHQNFHLGGRYVNPTGNPAKAAREVRVLPCSIHGGTKEEHKLNLSILYVCRRLYRETTKALYASNEYIFTEFTVFDSFMRTRTPLQIESITNLTLSMVFTSLAKGVPSCYATHHRWNHSLRSEVVTKLQGLRVFNAKVCLAFVASCDFSTMKRDLVKDFNYWFEGLLNFAALPHLKSVEVLLDDGVTDPRHSLLHNAEFSRTEALRYSDRITAYISKEEMRGSARIPRIKYVDTTSEYLKEDISQPRGLRLPHEDRRVDRRMFRFGTTNLDQIVTRPEETTDEED